MQHVTFDTAKRLKEAGFPRPAVQPTQFWYAANGGLFIVCQYFTGAAILRSIGTKEEIQRDLREMDLFWRFAPTATDILQLLPSDLSLRFETFLTKCFYIESFEKVKGIRCGGTMNAAEVCAREFFRMKEEAQ